MENLVGIELAYINTKHPDFGDAELVALLSANASNREMGKRLQTASSSTCHQQTVKHGEMNKLNVDSHSSQAAQVLSYIFSTYLS